MLFNQGDLEECDSLPEDVLYMVRMDLKDGKITQKVRISTIMCQYLSHVMILMNSFFCTISDQSLDSPMVVHQNNKPE